MPQVINTNIMSLMTRNQLNKSQSSLNTSIERLSSGKRINSAKDDAAGQAIANRFTANIRGLTQASRNANDGISISQTAEGALSEINNNVQRIRELTVKAANGTNSEADVKAINNEIRARLDEIDRISEQTDFNGVKLLGGKEGKDTKLVIQVGANDKETITIDLTALNTKTLKIDDFEAVPGQADPTPTPTPPPSQGDKTPPAKMKVTNEDQLKTLDEALAQIDGLRSQFGAAQSRFESAASSIDNTSNNMSAARSRIEDADYAEEVSNMTRAQILQQAGTSVLAQANQIPQLVLSLLQ